MLYKCEKCEKQFKTPQARGAHQRVHSLNPRSGLDIQAAAIRSKLKSKKMQQEYYLNPLKCKQCNTIISYRKYLVRKSEKTYNPNSISCSRSCATTYQNTHKAIGIRRSKLEAYIEEQLTLLYPNLVVHYNRKDTINSELDIYIPTLKLAVELNGIFHYEPIFSPEQLARSQNNDQRKMQACIERGIELCVIDTSKQTYFKPASSARFLDIIVSLIRLKAASLGIEPSSTEINNLPARLVHY
jgi:hypothetical protein